MASSSMLFRSVQLTFNTRLSWRPFKPLVEGGTRQLYTSSAYRTSSKLGESFVKYRDEGSEREFRRRSIKDVSNFGVPDDKVQIQGWVKSFRKLKENVFLDISDGSSEHRLSAVVRASEMPKGVNMHTAVDITGILQRNPNNPALMEIHPTIPLQLVGPCDQKTFPFGGKIRYTPDYIRQYVHLRPKTKKFSSMLRLRSEVSRAISDYFTQNDFVQIHVPILTSNDCEGAGETFTVRPSSEQLLKEISAGEETNEENQPCSNPKLTLTPEEIFFDKRVHLSVSGQLHLECAANGLDKVWTCSPVFRAENTQSTRHLSEFYMVEAEMAFMYNIEQILEVMEGLVKSCVRRILTDCVTDWNVLTRDNEDKSNLRTTLDNILKHGFTVMTFEEASNLLKDKASSTVHPGRGLSREQELILTERLNDNRPVFVIDWPGQTKPFYMRECSYDSTKVSAVDLLVPTVGELCGGSLREADLLKLVSKINLMDTSGELEKSLSWYLDLRKFGGTPTGGFGLGFDRLMQLMTGIGNIKDVSPFPRWPHHCPM